MNMMGQGNILGNTCGRGRGRGRGKIGTIQNNQKPVNLVPKYRILETPGRFVNNLGTSTSTSSASRTPHYRGTTTSSSARQTMPGSRNKDGVMLNGESWMRNHREKSFLYLQAWHFYEKFFRQIRILMKGDTSHPAINDMNVNFVGQIKIKGFNVPIKDITDVAGGDGDASFNIRVKRGLK